MPPNRVCQNPIFAECITYHLQAAEARGAKVALGYRKALNVLLNHPSVLESPADAQKLNGIGPGIVRKIQKWMDTCNKSVSEPVSKKRVPKKRPKETNNYEEEKEEEEMNTKQPRSATPEEQFPLIAPIIFEPNTFELILILDTREIKDMQDRNYFSTQLQKRGINVEVRTLELGDAIWIARRTDGAELVLDYIIERKRMDDLVASIKNGRFVEQKARLVRSGASNIVYIIEEYASPNVAAFNPQAIITAISTTQVIDGFFVKRTSSTEHTVDYLAKLHTALTGIYSKQQLSGIPDEHVNRTTFLALKQHLATKHFVSYHSFCMLNSKAGSTTLGDTFVAILSTIRGVSGAKAIEIAKKYRTPHGLLTAYTALDNDEDRKEMIHNSTRHAINIATSTKICNIWFA
jgi:crossover junction endonuclease MUS81